MVNCTDVAVRTSLFGGPIGIRDELQRGIRTNAGYTGACADMLSRSSPLCVCQAARAREPELANPAPHRAGGSSSDARRVACTVARAGFAVARELRTRAERG